MRELPKRTNYFFDQFCSAANRQCLHPLDWRRFYHFIQAAHQGRTKISRGAVKELLVVRGFSEDYAEELATVYEHGRELLSCRRVDLQHVYRRSLEGRGRQEA